MQMPIAPAPRIVAAARETLQDTRLMTSVNPRQRADLVDVAFAILREARAARLGQTLAQAAGPARVICIPRALFQSGRIPPRRPRLVVTPSGPTSGDAA